MGLGPRRLYCPDRSGWSSSRSEEHTSELQSLMRNSYDVFCFKKKKHERQQTNFLLPLQTTSEGHPPHTIKNNHHQKPSPLPLNTHHHPDNCIHRGVQTRST